MLYIRYLQPHGVADKFVQGMLLPRIQMQAGQLAELLTCGYLSCCDTAWMRYTAPKSNHTVLCNQVNGKSLLSAYLIYCHRACVLLSVSPQRWK